MAAMMPDLQQLLAQQQQQQQQFAAQHLQQLHQQQLQQLQFAQMQQMDPIQLQHLQQLHQQQQQQQIQQLQQLQQQQQQQQQLQLQQHQQQFQQMQLAPQLQQFQQFHQFQQAPTQLSHVTQSQQALPPSAVSAPTSAVQGAATAGLPADVLQQLSTYNQLAQLQSHSEVPGIQPRQAQLPTLQVLQPLQSEHPQMHVPGLLSGSGTDTVVQPLFQAQGQAAAGVPVARPKTAVELAAEAASAEAGASGPFFSFDAPVDSLRIEEELPAPAPKPAKDAPAVASAVTAGTAAAGTAAEPVESLRQDTKEQQGPALALAGVGAPVLRLGEVKVLAGSDQTESAEQENLKHGEPQKPQTLSGGGGWTVVEERSRSRNRRRSRRRRRSDSSNTQFSGRTRRRGSSDSSSSSSSSRRRRRSRSPRVDLEQQKLGATTEKPADATTTNPLRVAFKTADATLVAKEKVVKEKEREKKERSGDIKALSIMEQFEEQRKRAAEASQSKQDGQRQFTIEELLEGQGQKPKEVAQKLKPLPQGPRSAAAAGRSGSASDKSAASQGALPKELHHLQQMLRNQEQPKSSVSLGGYRGSTTNRPMPSTSSASNATFPGRQMPTATKQDWGQQQHQQHQQHGSWNGGWGGSGAPGGAQQAGGKDWRGGAGGGRSAYGASPADASWGAGLKGGGVGGGGARPSLPGRPSTRGAW